MMIVLMTVFFMGGATEAVLKWLDIEMNVNAEAYLQAWQQSEQAPAPNVWTYLGKCQDVCFWKMRFGCVQCLTINCVSSLHRQTICTTIRHSGLRYGNVLH